MSLLGLQAGCISTSHDAETSLCINRDRVVWKEKRHFRLNAVMYIHWHVCEHALAWSIQGRIVAHLSIDTHMQRTLPLYIQTQSYVCMYLPLYLQSELLGRLHTRYTINGSSNHCSTCFLDQNDLWFSYERSDALFERVENVRMSDVYLVHILVNACVCIMYRHAFCVVSMNKYCTSIDIVYSA